MIFIDTLFEALNSIGFIRAFFYSFGSFLLGWLITFFALPEINQQFGSWAWIVPLINIVLVGIKQYADSWKSK